MEKLLELKGITKRFPGVLALDNVNLELRSGEVHVLMGENGAGKSTLMKVIDGLYTPEEGQMFLYGEETRNSSPLEAMEKGIAMIHQELNTVLDMTVAENTFLGREIGKGIFFSRKEMNKQTEIALSELGVNIPPNSIMRNLSVAKRQMVEIAKAISLNARILIMDEPTSAITDKEVDALFKVIEMFKAKGVGIIYISHKMNEIFRIADRITVLRDGKTVGTYNASDIDNDKLISLMVGREIADVFPPRSEQHLGEIALEVNDLSDGQNFSNASFSLKKGEILGLAGLMGAGRSELAETIFGMRKHTSGSIKINGQSITIKHPKDAIGAGVALITEDRKHTGLNLKTSVKKDMSIVNLSKFCKWGTFVSDKDENKIVDEYIERLKVKTPSRNQSIKNLSGGNQQKVIIARWLIGAPDVFILDEPTRGIDVGAKYDIYVLINELAALGKAVLMISSELPEIIGVCDRVLVMHEGKIKGELNKNEMTQPAIMAFASGMEG